MGPSHRSHQQLQTFAETSSAHSGTAVQTAVLSTLHVHVLPIAVQLPTDAELIALRSAAAAAGQLLARGRVHRKREEVRRLAEIGIPIRVDEEVYQDDDVHGEDHAEDQVEAFLVRISTSTSVLLGARGGVEPLVLARRYDRSSVVPEVDKRGVLHRLQKSAARQYCQCLG